MSATDEPTDQIAGPSADGADGADGLPQHDLLTDDERAALALPLTDEDGEGQGQHDEDDEDGQVSQVSQVSGGEDGQALAQAGEDDAGKGLSTARLAEPAGDEVAWVPEAASGPGVGAQVPLFSYELPADYSAKVMALEGRFIELDQKLDDGEIDQLDYNKAFRSLAREQSALEGMANRAELAREMAQQQFEQLARHEGQLWGQAVQALIAETRGHEGAPDYAGDEREALALGKQVEALMVARGMDVGQPVADKSDLLRQAHRALVFARTGRVLDAQVLAGAPGVQAQAARSAAARARKPDLSTAARSIALVPAADNGAQGGEFAQFDKLSGEKLETALTNLARRDPVAYERYLSEV